MPELLFDIETLGLDPFAGRIIAVGYRMGRVEKVLDGDERSILTAFSKALGKADLVVGYNIQEFDIPFTKVRCVKHGVRIEFPPVLDLAKLWPYRKRLEDWCRFLNIKKRFEVDGSRMAELFLEGNIGAVRAHCLDDLRATQAIWRRFKKTLHPSSQ